MKITNEWEVRLRHWVQTLTRDFYTPLGEIAFDAFLTYDYLTPEEALKQDFARISPGDQWGREWQYAWLKARLVLPREAEGKVIVMDLRPGGETTLFVNGNEFGTYRGGSIPVNHHFMVDNILTESGKANEEYRLLCEVYAGHFFPESYVGMVSTGPVLPGTYQDPYAGKERAVLGLSTFGVWNEDAYQLWLDVQALLEIMEGLPDSSLRGAKIFKALQGFTYDVDFEQEADKRIECYKRARGNLKSVLQAQNGSTAPVFYAVGNSHLDICWLWPLAETKRKTARTFAAQLRLLEKYPTYRYLQSQPASYALCKEHYPGLYARIKTAIKEGRWIAEGGMWVEPDTNMASGESLIRQLIHGMRFFKEEFGIDCKILWLPDTFGYSAVLPQILKNFGIKYLVTQKIFWSYNGGDQFPYHYFTWQGMDGSGVTSFLPTSYTYTTNPGQLTEVWENRVQKDDMDKFLLPFGYGDGGGGPCRDHVELALREENLEGCPKVELAGPLKLFEDLENDGGPAHTYVGELYFNAHRGVYTSQTGVKRGNRKAESALREAEIWGAIGSKLGFAYPYDKMDIAWKKALTCQFHDILPGSSIKRVYEEATKDYKEIGDISVSLIKNAAGFITGDGSRPMLFNSLSWDRDVVLELPEEEYLCAFVPACGYAAVPDHDAFEPRAEGCLSDKTAVLSNEYINVTFNENGEITSFILKESGREFAAGPMNRFLLYKDVPRYFDAWDIDSIYENEPVAVDMAATVTLVNAGPYKASLRIEKIIGNSTLTQIVSLSAKSRKLEFDTMVCWNELHRLLKVGFPIHVHTEEAIHEMQFGYVKRPAHRSRDYDKDRFEVCNHRYTALCDESHGAAVLNDCKYGVSALGNEIRLTLLRAEASPEMRGDNGVQRFAYAFTAWDGTFMDSLVVREGYELNVPPTAVVGRGDTQSFFQVNCPNIIIDTVKLAEDQSGDIILRLYESKHADCECSLHWNMPAANASITGMAEDRDSDAPLMVEDNTVILHFRPFEVKTIRLS